MNNTLQNRLESDGAIYIKDVLTKDVCNLLSACLLRNNYYESQRSGDLQVPDAAALMDHEILFETVQEKIWAALENLLQIELLPTYSYARLYKNGNVLDKHKDRPSCEISLTVQLARTHNYSWPIFMGNKRYDLAEGDGVIYKGCDIEHWRESCNGPEDYLSGQAFFHFVNAKGQYKDFANDKRQKEFLFVRNRHLTFESK